MKFVFNKGRDRLGAVSFELVLVFMMFVLIFIAISDVARFYVTANSVRTLSSELVRQTLIYCATQSQSAVCALPATGANSVATAESVVPFLSTSGFAATPSASRSAMNTSTGAMSITASANYNFSFMLPIWRGTVSHVAQNTLAAY
ncbi:hypothetical protein [Bradyrhizobium sp. CCBAU 53338]|uniref:hypothetical protein n=1 Tax=Bradyrhizobium sp. CCBAU 53338 TaxID=1325111 RepID=UPI00188B69FB|nr:hypothetical protein [Bradyrhizobium sp. CCBAU 53338]QOZ52212.1 hypothetical protein XH90_13140 [Bradyrhizobium sp. CCBAU 53338]